jgi:hypothetical protein
MGKRNTIHKLPEYKGYSAYYYYDDEDKLWVGHVYNSTQLTESLRTWLRGMIQKKNGWNPYFTAWLTITLPLKNRWSTNTESG